MDVTRKFRVDIQSNINVSCTTVAALPKKVIACAGPEVKLDGTHQILVLSLLATYIPVDRPVYDLNMFPVTQKQRK